MKLNVKRCIGAATLFTLAWAVPACAGAAGMPGSSASPQPVYVADMPAERVWAAQDSGVLGRNKAVADRDRPQSGADLRIADKQYDRGLGSHANGKIYVDLGGIYETFEAEVGIQRGKPGVGSAIFRVLVDGEERFNSKTVKEGEPPRKVSVPVKGAAELLLLAESPDMGRAYVPGVDNAGAAADWADARLVPSATVPARVALPPGNIAPYARAFTADSGRADAALQKAAASDPGQGCVVAPQAGAGIRFGLAWDDARFVRRLTVVFPTAAEMPNPSAIKLQAKSLAGWQDLPAKCYADRNTLTWWMDPQAEEARLSMREVQWVLAATQQTIAIAALRAYDQTGSGLKTAEIRIEAVTPKKGTVMPIEVSSGVLADAKTPDASRGCTWDMGAPLQIKVAYDPATSLKSQRTVLRFQTPGEGFSVAVNDVLENDCVYVPDAGVFVTRVPQPVTLKDYLAALPARKTVLDAVREMPDQTFAQAMEKVHRPPAQDRGPMMLSLACDNRKFVVDADGTIQGRTIQGKLYVTFGSGGEQAQSSRHLDGGWHPIPVSSVTRGGVAYRQRTCVAPYDDQPPDGAPDWARDRALCVVEYVVENPGRQDADASVALRFVSGGGRGKGHGAPREPELPRQAAAVKGGAVAKAGDDLFAFVAAPEAGSLGVAVTSGTVTLAGKLPAGKSARFYVYLPAWRVAPEDYATLTGGSQLFDRTVSYWDRVLAPAMQLDLPDGPLADLIRASQIHCMLAARSEKNWARVAAWIDSYGDAAPADTNSGALDSESQSVIRGMDMMGNQEFARRALDYWIARYKPEGWFRNYSIAGVGENLWTLAEHYRRTQDRAWLEKVAPTVLSGCKWISGERRKSMIDEVLGQKPPEWGLMPPDSSADWKLRAYRFFNEAQFYAGLTQAGRTLADINIPDAPALVQDAEQYHQDILRAYRWNQERSPVRALANGTWVRHYPSFLYCFESLEYHFPTQDSFRAWVYDIELGAHHLALDGVLDPQSAEVTDMVNHMEDVQFWRSRMGDYSAEKNRQDVLNTGGFARFQPYYCRIAELHALRDDVKPFIRSYFNAIPPLLCTENLSFWECPRGVGAWNKTHETGWFLSQTRVLFVQERGKDLWLAPFVTNNWLKDGLKVAVRNAPTDFGKVSYEIVSSVGQGFITATVQPPSAVKPDHVVIRLRHPDGKAMQSVTVNGAAHRDFDPRKECVTIMPVEGPIMVRASY